jgi:predicted DNA-binding transcriptional regulator AlpA
MVAPLRAVEGSLIGLHATFLNADGRRIVVQPKTAPNGPDVAGAAATIALRIRDLRRHLGVSRSQIYKLIELPDFPPARQLGPHLRVWLRCEVEAWLRSRPAAKPARLPHLHGGEPPEAA